MKSNVTVSSSERYWFSYEEKAYKYHSRFVIHPLQNPPFCSSTVAVVLNYPPAFKPAKALQAELEGTMGILFWKKGRHMHRCKPYTGTNM
jgi:hypothetical protein